MSVQLPGPAASNTLERSKRISPAGAEFWSAHELVPMGDPFPFLIYHEKTKFS
jgi:hypothetical protein